MNLYPAHVISRPPPLAARSFPPLTWESKVFLGKGEQPLTDEGEEGDGHKTLSPRGEQGMTDCGLSLTKMLNFPHYYFTSH